MTDGKRAQEAAAECDLFFGIFLAFFSFFHSDYAPLYLGDVESEMLLIYGSKRYIALVGKFLNKVKKLVELYALFIAYLQKNAPDFFQQSPDALYGCILAIGDILKIITAGSHPHYVHLLLGDTFGQVV